MTNAQKAYSNLLEEHTGCTIESTRDRDGDQCFYVIDTCGDRYGEAWYSFEDLILETQDAIDAAVDDMNELVGWRFVAA